MEARRALARLGLALFRTGLAVSHLDDVLTLLCLSLLISSVHSDRTEPGGFISARCMNFTRGNEILKEFYSPGWPGLYPNNTDCVRTISAPERHIIKIDFRDIFEVEDSPRCENDFLMVRDGSAPYSPELTRLCGHQFPSMISSSGSHLWLRFKTDDTIQYRGFRAVYTFRKNEAYAPSPECKFEVTGPEAVISTANITDEWIQQALDNDVPLDCSWRVRVNRDREIQISFKEFTLDMPNECQLNFVEVLYGPELHLISETHFCSSKAETVKLPTDRDVTFRFFAAPPTLASLQDQKTSVVAVATELRSIDSDRDEQCGEDEFDCDDLTCISTSLVCNGNYNCDKQLDEKNCDTDKDNGSKALLTKANIVIMVIGCALLFGLCFSVCWNCIRKLREDFREKEEMVRMSREADLDALPAELPRVISRGTLDDGGCYVPGIEIKLTPGPPHRNGGGRVVREDLIELDVETAERGCQTPAGRRDSRDSCASGSSTPPPPPPPPPPRPPASTPAAAGYRYYPPPAAYDPARSERGRRPAGRLRQPDPDDEDEPSGLATPRSYRSEAVIEMAHRPTSMHSAKSAPDVVVKL